MISRLRLMHIALSLAIAFAMVETPVRAGKFNRALSVGDMAPAWKDLIGVDDKRHSLNDCKSKLVILVFIANHCPVAAAYEDRLKQLTTDYGRDDVELIAVSVSRLDSDRLDKMKERTHDSKFSFPYIQDLSQTTGHRYGATATPQIFVLNAERRIGYMGAIDDQWRDVTKVESHYARSAIDSLLAGNQPEIRETRPVGCAIEYSGATQK